MTKIVTSEQETIEFANEFSQLLKGGEIIALNGELGSGKTFFVKHVAKNFGINNVNSPSFAIVYEYYGDVKINHFDFYRINKIEELYDIGFEEYLTNNNSITFIEWANMFPEILPEKRIEIFFKINEDFSREIKIKEWNTD